VLNTASLKAFEHMHLTSTHQVASRLVELIGCTAALYMERTHGSIENFINREIRCILAYEFFHMFNSRPFLSSSI
jgi:hypothetical protein